MSSATYRLAQPISQQHDAFTQVITALSFDPTCDTLWSGANTGKVTAYYTPQGVRGVSFPVGGGLSVNKLVVDDTQVRAYGVSAEGVGAWSKGGVNKWYYRYVISFLRCRGQRGNTLQPLRVRDDVFKHTEPFQNTCGLNIDSRDHAVKLHYRKRD